jgi:hypothetical protein
MFRHKRMFLLVFVLLSLDLAYAQYELPDEIFQRTLLIRSGNEMATAFKFDQDGKVYLVTTRHLAKNLPEKKAIIQVWHGSWIDLTTIRTLLSNY